MVSWGRGEGIRAMIVYLLHWCLQPHREAVLLYLPTVMLVSDLFVDVGGRDRE